MLWFTVSDASVVPPPPWYNVAALCEAIVTRCGTVACLLEGRWACLSSHPRACRGGHHNYSDCRLTVTHDWLQISTEVSVQKQLEYLTTVTQQKDNGRFVGNTGKDLPW